MHWQNHKVLRSERCFYSSFSRILSAIGYCKDDIMAGILRELFGKVADSLLELKDPWVRRIFLGGWQSDTIIARFASDKFIFTSDHEVDETRFLLLITRQALSNLAQHLLLVSLVRWSRSSAEIIDLFEAKDVEKL